ncbi:MAG: TlpA disulfide reductase family protein [Pyrinomonadaceae bacterium]
MKNFKHLFVILSLIFAFSSFGAAQNLRFSTLDGSNFSLQADKGKVVILAVGATWLPLSANQAIVTNMLAKKFAGRDVAVYFLATDSSDAKSKNFASNADIQTFAARNKVASNSVLRDSDGGVILKRFKLDQIPAFIIFDKEGKSAGEPFGGLTPKKENDLLLMISKRIDELL